jgi:hypothetical protein
MSVSALRTRAPNWGARPQALRSDERNRLERVFPRIAQSYARISLLLLLTPAAHVRHLHPRQDCMRGADVGGRTLSNVHGCAGRQHHIGTSQKLMAVAWINDLDINLEAGGPTHDAGHPCGFVPLKVRARRKPKALLAPRMIDEARRDADRFIAVGIVVGDDPDVSRHTDASVDRAPSRVLHTKSQRCLLTDGHSGRDHERQGERFPKLRKNSTGLLRARCTPRTADCYERECVGSNRSH